MEESIDPGHFKQKLLALKTALTGIGKSSDEATDIVTLDQSCVGRLSRMDAMQSQAMIVDGKRRRALQLHRIDAALKRIEEDDFGYCLSCGEEISVRRLEFDPATPVCIDCAGK